MDNFCGKRLDGRYEIREIIGVGGMAVVYKAYDNIDDRIVAIKILKDEYLTNEEFKRRFKNESKAIAVLSHPNIVRVYNVSFGDRLQYIVMEYVDGITLKEYIEQQGVINWKEAVHFTGQILAALQHAHDKGIVHQDIKPQNIMLLHDGTIKVTDFGIARFSRLDNDTTSENAIGSVHYISPEQARGEMTDDKADIYSVGVVLYEMITGQLPFQSDSAVSVALMQLQKDPTRPRELVPTLPLGLEQITIRAMQKNASDRYHSAAEMLMDINEFKRNPAVKFNYSYFVDREPTRYVPQTGVQTVIPSATELTNEEEAEEKSVNKTTAIMIGAISGIVVLAIIIFAIISAVGNKKISVPNFIGKNYGEIMQLEETDYKDFKFEVKYVQREGEENGKIVSQDPEADKKVKKGTTITLSVVNNGEEVIEEKILSMSEEQAYIYLRNTLMLVPETIYEQSDEEPGTVLRTDPPVGSKVSPGSKVKLYIASKDTVKVPLVVDSTLADAEITLKACGLQLGKVEEVPSELEKGVVIFQSIEEDSIVPAGTKVNLQVSNGNKPDVSVEISVILLNTNETKKVEIYLNNELRAEVDNVLQNGIIKPFTVSGSGDNVPYSVKIGDTIVQEGTINFNEAKVTTTSAILPNVMNMSESEAKLKLSKVFTNITESQKIVDDAHSEGTVIDQSPRTEGNTKYPTNTEITLYVATKSAEVAD